MPSGPERTPARRRAIKKNRAVLHFASTHDTILAEKVATQHGYDAEIIPRPPGMTGRCGIALRVAAADVEALKDIFANTGLAGFDVVKG